VAEDASRKVVREALRQMRALGEAALPVALEMLDSNSWRERKGAAGLLLRWKALTPDRQDKIGSDPHIAVREVLV
jgi:hypothetical protein